MKKRLLIGKIIGFIGINIFAIGISYTITYFQEKENFSDINLLITFEDNKTFKLENTRKLEKDEALKTYPYIFTIQNKGKSVDYEIQIIDVKSTNLERKNLNYILFLDDKEVKNGLLSELNNDLLYKTSLKKNEKITYKLYIYLNEEIDEANYEYEIKINSNK